MNKYFFLALICASLCFPILAQDEGERDLSATGTFEDEMGINGEKKAKDPLVPPAGLPPAMSEERSKQISKYFDEALSNYEDILSNRPEAEVQSTEKRIESIREMLESQESNLGASESSLRKIKLAYLKQYLALKNSFEQGAIDKKTYYQKVDDLGRKYAHDIQSLKEDVAYYRTQSDKTSGKLKEQQEINRVNKIFLVESQKNKPAEVKAPAEPPRIPNELEMLLPRIEAAGCFKDKNVGRASDIK